MPFKTTYRKISPLNMDYHDQCFNMHFSNHRFNSDHLDRSELPPFDPQGHIFSMGCKSTWKNSCHSEPQLDNFYQRKHGLGVGCTPKNCFNRQNMYDQNFVESAHTSKITSKHFLPKKVDSEWRLLKENTSISKAVNFEEKFPFGPPKFSFPRLAIFEPPTQLHSFRVLNDEQVFSKKENDTRTHIPNPFLRKKPNFSVVSTPSDGFPFPLHSVSKTFGMEQKAQNIASEEMDKFTSDTYQLSPMVAQLHDISNKLSSCISNANQLSFHDREVLQLVIDILKPFAIDNNEVLRIVKTADSPSTEFSGESVYHLQDQSDNEELSQEKVSWLDAEDDNDKYNDNGEDICDENAEVKGDDCEDYYCDQYDNIEKKKQNDTQDYEVDSEVDDKESRESLLISNASSLSASNDDNEDIDEVVYKGRQEKEAYQFDEAQHHNIFKYCNHTSLLR